MIQALSGMDPAREAAADRALRMDATRLRNAPSSTARIREALELGPATATQMAAMIGLPMRKCSSFLGSMKVRGEVRVIGKIGQWRQCHKIYELIRKA